jgi:hypothetical protein
MPGFPVENALTMVRKIIQTAIVKFFLRDDGFEIFLRLFTVMNYA